MSVRTPFVVHVVAADVSAFKLAALRELCSRPELPACQAVLHVGPGLPRAAGLPRPICVRAPLDVGWLRARALRRVLDDLTGGHPVPLRPILHVWSAVALAWCTALAGRGWALLVDVDPCPRLWRAARLVTRQAEGRNAFVCPTELMRARLRQAGVQPGACLLIRESVDSAGPDRARTAGLRQRLDLTPDQSIVVVLPPVSRDAGALTATWAGLLLATACPEVRLVVPDGRGREHERLRRLVRSVHHEHTVRFAGPDLLPSELVALADVAVFLPVRDVSLTGLFQAMKAGRPVVATTVPPVSEFLLDKKNAWLCPPDSPHQAARRMLQVLVQPEEGRRRGKQAGGLAQGVFGRPRVIERYASAYASLAAGRPDFRGATR